MRLTIKVVPRASRSGLAGWLGDALKIRVAAPPEGGKANAAVLRVLSDALGVARTSVRIVSGETAALKIVEIAGIDAASCRRRLDAAREGP